MTIVSKGAVKARMLESFRQVEPTGEELIVTDDDRPVLKVVPIATRQPASKAFADVRGRVVITRVSSRRRSTSGRRPDRPRHPRAIHAFAGVRCIC